MSSKIPEIKIKDQVEILELKNMITCRKKSLEELNNIYDQAEKKLNKSKICQFWIIQPRRIKRRKK